MFKISPIRPFGLHEMEIATFFLSRLLTVVDCVMFLLTFRLLVGSIGELFSP